MPISDAADEEQLQVIKKWWRQYGNYILLGILAFFIVNFSYRYWQKYKNQRLDRTSITYMQMLVAVEQKKNSDEIRLYANQLINGYPSSTYASLAAFTLAKVAVQNGNLQQAQEKLQFVIKKSSNDALRQIARIRCARILIAKKQPQEALKLLATVNDNAYVAEINEIRGDALLALGNIIEAKRMYQKAQNMIVGEIKLPLLQLKMQQT